MRTSSSSLRSLLVVFLAAWPLGTLLHADDFSGWPHFWQGPGLGSEPFAIQVDRGGDVYVVGNNFTDSNREDDFALIKFDAAGRLLWSRVQDEDGVANYPFGMALDNVGNV